ncbi:MAG: STAS/SEC14 domain-containing protein [Moraxellaceae bacterium]|nr:STAS/SEC14 domain-containing protein [Moraxellaceae bacterium]
MITTDVMSDRVELRAFGAFTLEDCLQFEEQSDYRIRFNGPIDLLVDLRNMTDYSLDVVVEELRYARRHAHDFRRIAVLTDDQWVTWGMMLTQAFVDAEIRIFDEDDSANAWLQEGRRGSGIEATIADDVH